jgi:hypothetical protein
MGPHRTDSGRRAEIAESTSGSTEVRKRSEVTVDSGWKGVNEQTK